MTFKKMLQKTDKIIFGHPGIGKSFCRLTNPNIIVPVLISRTIFCWGLKVILDMTIRL